jgi:cardiolipin synthase
MRLKPQTTAGKLAAALLGMLLSALAALLVVNFYGGEKDIVHLEKRYSSSDPQFLHTLGVMLGPPITSGNRIEALYNGDQIFPAMLRAIHGAQKSVSFETFIYWSGDIGRQFADAFAERARAGVKVHVLLDWVGSNKIDDALIEEMAAAGVQVRYYHPLAWYQLGRMNNRTHRKLLVVDGKTAFTGGVGIAPEWTGNAQDPDHWRDSHFRAEGPVAAQMQAVFGDNWTKTTGEVLHGPEYFPAIERAGDLRAQVFSSSPTGGSHSMQLMYLLAITAAEKSVDLSASYFVPDEVSTEALVAAMQRGVRVRIIVPGPNIDTDTVRRSSRGLWGPLLEAGAKIAEYQPTMYHCKVMIVDEMLVSVGSTNFDERSFSLNDEANLNVYDAGFARTQTQVFERDWSKSRPISLKQWQNRPMSEKLHEKAAAWLQPLL